MGKEATIVSPSLTPQDRYSVWMRINCQMCRETKYAQMEQHVRTHSMKITIKKRLKEAAEHRTERGSKDDANSCLTRMSASHWILSRRNR